MKQIIPFQISSKYYISVYIFKSEHAHSVILNYSALMYIYMSVT